jgi:hypothetical protein
VLFPVAVVIWIVLRIVGLLLRPFGGQRIVARCEALIVEVLLRVTPPRPGESTWSRNGRNWSTLGPIPPMYENIHRFYDCAAHWSGTGSMQKQLAPERCAEFEGYWEPTRELAFVLTLLAMDAIVAKTDAEAIGGIQRQEEIYQLAVTRSTEMFRRRAAWHAPLFAPRAASGERDARRTGLIGPPGEWEVERLVPSAPSAQMAQLLGRARPGVNIVAQREAFAQCFERMVRSRNGLKCFLLEQWAAHHLEAYVGGKGATRIVEAATPAIRAAVEAGYVMATSDPERTLEAWLALEAAIEPLEREVDRTLSDPECAADWRMNFMARVDRGMREANEFELPEIIDLPVLPDDFLTRVQHASWTAAHPDRVAELTRCVRSVGAKTDSISLRFYVLLYELRLGEDFSKPLAAELAPLLRERLRADDGFAHAHEARDGDALLAAVIALRSEEARLLAAVRQLAERTDQRREFEAKAARPERLEDRAGWLPIVPMLPRAQELETDWVAEWGRAHPDRLSELRDAHRAAVEDERAVLRCLNGTVQA